MESQTVPQCPSDQAEEMVRRSALQPDSEASPVSSAPSSRFHGWVLCCLLLTTLAVAVVMRLHRLGDLTYWFDESYSLRTAEFPPQEMIFRCAQDTHPPFYYFTLKAWMACFGNSEWEARLLSTLWSLGAVVAAFGFTYEGMSCSKDRPSSRNVALFAATLAGLCVALSPIQISWAQQVRMYAPDTCLAILGTWLLWRAVQEPHLWGRWISYAVIEVAGLYTHVTMLFIFAAHVLAVWAVLLQGRKNWAATKFLFWRAGIVMGTVGLIALPWVLVVRAQHARVHNDFWIPPFSMELLSTALVQCFTLYQHPMLDPKFGLWLGQGLLLILICVAAGRRPFDLLLALSASLPFLLLIAVSQGETNIVDGRYFITGQSLVCLAVPVGIARLPSWFLRFPFGIVLLGTMSYLAYDHWGWRESVAGQRAIPELLASWKEHRGADEPLIFCNPMYYITARIYHDPADLKIYGQEQDYPFYNGTAVTTPQEFLSASELDSGDWQTAWVCHNGNWGKSKFPEEIGKTWRLSAETAMKDYSGTYFLRRYDRIEKQENFDIK